MVPSRSFHVTQAIIDRATPDHRGLCLGALAVRDGLKEAGVMSIYVTPDTVRFNLPDGPGGSLLRYIYLAPAQLTRAAHLFDEMGREHGSEHARKHTKPFKFRLQGRDGWVQPTRPTPSGKDRIKRGERRVRASSTHERVTRCARRYHPLEAYRVNKGRAVK